MRAAASAVRRRRRQPDTTLQQLGVSCATSRTFGFSSGKAALTMILRALGELTGRRKVILPAYSCYSVPSAIVRAGLDPVPCDIGPDSFDYDYEHLLPMLGPDVLCVLSIHLFGIPSDTRRLVQPCHDEGIFVVEDAAQAMGVTVDGVPLGSLGDAGFFSLGRGKNINCGSGGLVLTRSPEIAAVIDRLAQYLPAPGMVADIRTLGTVALQNLFLSPSLFWLPAGLPFLKLGETIFHRDFPVGVLPVFQSALLQSWPEQIASLTATRLSHSEYYVGHITSAHDYGREVPYLRFPLVLDTAEAKRHLLADPQARALGITGMYPGTIGSIPELAASLTRTAFPRAQRVASTLVTLPTHPLLRERDREAICRLVEEVANRAPDARIAS
jgi:perosamine synthetase